MAAYQWVPDTPSGPIRNRALSKDLRFASIAGTKGLQFVRRESALGRKSGDTVTIERMRNVAEPNSAVLGRNQKIPIDSLATAATTITVSRYGRAIEFSEEVELLSYFAPEDFIQKSLVKQMKLTLDTVCFTAFKGSQIRYAPQGSSSGTFTTDAGSTSAVATSNLNIYHMKQLRDYLAATIHVEPYEGDDWMMLSSTKALRGMKDDPEFVDWRRYIDPEMAFYRGEVGMVEHIRCIEVTHANALSGSKGTGNVLGEAVVFGEDAVAMVEVQTPELRLGIPGNFGLQKAIAWYGILAFGEVWPTANDGEARIIYVTSS